jgi:hypothetical protein
MIAILLLPSLYFCTPSYLLPCLFSFIFIAGLLLSLKSVVLLFLLIIAIIRRHAMFPIEEE